MLNMIKLDWLGMKVYQKRFVFILLYFVGVGFFQDAVVIPILAFMMLSFSINPFAVEEKGKLDNLYLTLPVTRGNIVNARFALSLIMLLIGLAVGVAITLAFNAAVYGRTVIFYRSFKVDFDTMLLLICGSMLFYAIMNLSTFPILFKIGYAKGKALGYYLPTGVAGVAIGVVYTLYYGFEPFRMRLLSIFVWMFDNIAPTAIIMLGAAVLLLAASYIISQKVYAKREF